MKSKEDIAKFLGNRIRTIRVMKRKSMTELARELNIQNQRLGRYERGERLVPSDILINITIILNVGLEFFDINIKE